jgi:hypothetical protein
MSSIESIQITLENQAGIIAALQAQLEKLTASGSTGVEKVVKSKKAKAEKAEKAPRANSGQPTLQSAWDEKIFAEHLPKNGAKSAEYQAFLAKRVASAEAGELLYKEGQAAVKSGKKAAGDRYTAKEALTGAHMGFPKAWKLSHEAEWDAFKAEFEAAHPKSSKSSVAGDDSAGEGAEEGASQAEKKKGRKKDTELYSPEELVKVKAERAAKRAATKAKKDAGEADERKASVMAPATPSPEEATEETTEEGDFELEEEAAEEEKVWQRLPFTFKKVEYIRLGVKDAEGEIEWEEGADIWLSVNGEKGGYAGKLTLKNTIDSSPETMAAEPEI